MEARRVFLFLYLFLCGTFFCSVGFVRASTRIPDGTNITALKTWEKENGPYIIEGVINIRAELTIKPGTVVKFAYQKGEMQMFSRINAIGTANEKIIFTSIRDDEHGGDSNGDGNDTSAAPGDWRFINFGSAASSGEFRYVSLLYAGWRPNDFGNAIVVNNNDKVSIVRSEIKHTRGSGIQIICSLPTINENTFSQNRTGVYNSCTGKTPVLRNNSFYDNTSFGVSVLNSNGYLAGHIDARDNWWGDPSGPKHNTTNPAGKGNQVSDNILFDPWLGKDTNDDTPDPAIIIPGIMGSWEKDGAWQIDPIFHTYDNLIEAFIAAGYANDGKEMSVFPYQWRDSNVENAKLLHARIQKIKKDTGRPKVDIVAHSMGGLLAREYIESNYYDHDVDQLITVGTPHLGAPKDYIKWEAGAFFSDIFELAGKKFFEHEAKENKYDSVFHYIQGRPMESVRELLPVYDYLYDDNGSDYDLRMGYPENYPRNEFLENLNRADKTEALKYVEFTNIVGKKGDPESTISGYNTVNTNMGEKWKHGYPHGFEIPIISDQGLKTSDGDITVPLYSAMTEKISFDRTIYHKSSHNNLPTDAQQDILEILTGKRPDEKIDEWQIDNILIGLLFSPIDFQIVSPSGKRLGKNFETGGEYNEILGAYYTGSDTETEFIVIPNPEDGEYKILTQGTDLGDYKIEIAKISQNDEKEAEESVATFTGTAEPKKEEELKIEIKNDEVKKVEKLTAPGLANTEIRTGVSSSSSENTITVLENRSKIQKLDTLKNDIRQYFNANQIKKRKVAAEITKKLSKIRVYLKNYATGTKIKKIKIAKTKANQDIGKLIRFINKNSPKYITEEAKTGLIEDLNDLKID